MPGLIERLRAYGRPGDPRTVERFIRANGFPLVERRGVTFVYRGEADAVRLRHWIFGLPGEQPLARVDGTDLWHVFLELPPGSRVEYKFEVVADGEDRWINDPLNPVLALERFGAISVCSSFC